MSTVRFCLAAPFYSLCGSSSAVEHRLAKAGVASSNLVFRSIWRHSQVVRQRSAKPLFPSSNLGAASTVLYISCRGGGTGRRKGLKIPRRVISVPVQFRSSAPKKHSKITALQLLRGLDFCLIPRASAGKASTVQR